MGFEDDDIRMYTSAVRELSLSTVQGPSGTYHVKNGIVHYGYNAIPVQNFSTSPHAWNIFH
jgi:hypothetical protein